MNKLKSCPFCGGEADTLKANHSIFPWSVSHVCCAIGGGIVTTGFSSEAEAIEAWNKRAERTCHDAFNKKAWCFCCDACACVMPWKNSCSNEDIIRGGLLNYCPNCGAKVVDEMEQTTRYIFGRNMFEELRADIAREINARGEEAFNLALSEYGYVKIEEARDIELLRRKYVFEREGRIKALERLCYDMYADQFEHEVFTERMAELGLLEGN